MVCSPFNAAREGGAGSVPRGLVQIPPLEGNRPHLRVLRRRSLYTSTATCGRGLPFVPAAANKNSQISCSRSSENPS